MARAGVVGELAMAVAAVTRELYLAAPVGDAVYVHGPGYARHTGDDLVETVRHEALHFAADGERHYFARRLYRRRSADNGATWGAPEELASDRPQQSAGSRTFGYGTWLHPTRELLIERFVTTHADPAQPMFRIGNVMQRHYRAHYRLSTDGGRTWTAAQPVVDERPGYDERHWAPGVTVGEMGAVIDGQPVALPDGTLVFGFTRLHAAAPAADRSPRAQEHYATVIYAQARPDAAGTRLAWTFGAPIAVPFPTACGGCCEAATLALGGSRVVCTMRCQGDAALGIESSRQLCVSDDGGLTWSAPEPLRYDDGAPAWTPASVHQFFTSSLTGKSYVIANLLDRPSFDQTPRYPLCVAEFDCATCRVRRATVRVIQALPPGAPAERRYTNWGQYEDRRTGELVLLLPEQPKLMDFSAMTHAADYTADCLRYRVRLQG